MQIYCKESSDRKFMICFTSRAAGLRDVSVVKNAYCPSRELEFSSQHPYDMARNTRVGGFLTPLTSVRTHTRVLIHTRD